jgi:hypothetical protein
MNKCQDCNKKISNKSLRCSHCHVLYLWKTKQIPVRHGTQIWNYKGDKPKCLDCGKTLSTHKCIRCKKCAKQGPLHPNYVDGRSSEKYYCIDCGKKINDQTYFFGKKRCLSCSHKGKRNGHYGKVTSYPKWEKHKNIWMKSSYEIFFAKWCDKNKIKWQYEPKTFDLGKTTYTPDFYLPEIDTYIEVKGWWRPKSLCKYMRFCKRYRNIHIIVLNKQKLFFLLEGSGK